MQNAVVGHENPTIEVSPVDEELAELQAKADPGTPELSTAPSLFAMKHIAADGHALATAPARLEDPASLDAPAVSASADPHEPGAVGRHAHSR
jgi:hypothetical protein